jgi:hypothetical protein
LDRSELSPISTDDIDVIMKKSQTLANPNHMVIGQLVYDALDENQKSLFQRLVLSSEIWNYVNNNTEGNRYNVYTNKES